MTITFGGKWQLRPYDRRNWCLYEFRAPDPRNARTKGTEPKWVRLDEYFQSVGQAMVRVMEYALRDDGTSFEVACMDDLMAVVEHIDATARGLRESVEVA